MWLYAKLVTAGLWFLWHTASHSSKPGTEPHSLCLTGDYLSGTKGKHTLPSVLYKPNWIERPKLDQ